MTLPLKPAWLRATTMAPPSAVDRERNIISGVVVAEEGPFKSDGRGEFDDKALRSIVKMMAAKPGGLKSRFAHPSLSDDGIGKFLGRFHSPRLDRGRRTHQESDERKTVSMVRADLHLDPTSFEKPSGNLGKYVMDLAESDPDAFSTSLVLRYDEEFRLNKDGTRKTTDQGIELHPLWRPTQLHALDVVDTGDATNGLLSVDALPDAVVRQATALLDAQFGDCSREVVEARCAAWLSRYLDLKFGEKEPDPAPPPPTTPQLDARRLRLERMDLTVRGG
jgi:hypothetical protein